MLPNVGQNVQIHKNDDLDNIGESRVLDLRSEGIYLDLPLSKKDRRWLNLLADDFIAVSYVASDGAVFHFNAKVKGNLVFDNLPSVLIEMPPEDAITRIQRRSFVRIEIGIQVSILRFQLGEVNQLQTVYGMTYDLSGGGLSFRPTRAMDFKIGDHVAVKFNLPSDSSKDLPISAEGTIVREKYDEYNRLNFGVNFERISPSGQQRIIQFVFKKQIELRSKGLR